MLLAAQEGAQILFPGGDSPHFIPGGMAIVNCGTAWRAALSALARTPAESIIGLAVKLRAIRDDLRDGDTDFSHVILRSALRDAERLARKGARGSR